MATELSPWSNPFSLMSSFRRDMDELSSRFFSDWERSAMPGAGMGRGYSPQLDSYVHGNTLLFRLDLPGVDPQDIDPTVEGNRLTIKGERKPSEQHQEHVEGAQCLHSEVRYGSFVRTIALPDGVKTEELQARSHNGVLEITMPLPAAMVSKKVPIAVEGEGRKQLK